MSPIYLEEKLNINRVAVIGAGPCGLSAAKYLAAEHKFSQIDVFEQRASVGGVWNYTPLNVVDNEFTVPRTQPTKLPDTAVWTNDDPEAQFVSPVYDFLETNIPWHLMNYSDQKFPEGSSLFPKHAVVKQYLEDYAREVKPMLSLGTQVLGIQKVQSGTQMCWEVEVLELKSNQKRTSEFDAVLVASGHYNDPFIPDIKGLAEFNRLHPGCISHSKFYRRPDQYRGKKVVIVGNSASGIDLSMQIASVCQKPIIVSEKTAPVTAVEKRSWAKMVPEISEFLPSERAVRFNEGDIEKDIDAVVFCTGYFYSFPYLKSLNPPVITDGSYARHLYEHVLYIDDPTLAFLGIPQRVVPFPMSEAQAGFVARTWADRLPLPSHSHMVEWEARMLEEKGEGRFLHNLAFPKDVEYINRLHDASLSAKKIDGLENNGVGKTPPYWGADKTWVRENFPLIKIASRALGEKRHEVKSLEDLGFDYNAWKVAMEADDKLI
ncbi:Uu.00g062380.m01.CDS01 [Anthostomella pinea]|uniref:Uu.00g062380.m01.CDS01 n=1 Tax=Anthostomella pinea TaxID=933095 RepID=A0AAI8VT73_9PEZI|nr:Uu.00g062380.m01.CDS01 [Anthostomella pinea]